MSILIKPIITEKTKKHLPKKKIKETKAEEPKADAAKAEEPKADAAKAD